MILVYTLQASSAAPLTALEMKESSSPVSKIRSSTGSAKVKVCVAAMKFGAFSPGCKD